MNTAVPVTRTGDFSRRRRKTSRGSDSSISRLKRTARPRRHVMMAIPQPNAMIKGNQPPWGIFKALAEKNIRSNARRTPKARIASTRPHRHSVAATIPASNASMAMAPVTDMPYAAASAPDEPNPMTRESTPNIRIQLIRGMYTCPISCSEVWRIDMRGR